jgi:hypothetical protein
VTTADKAGQTADNADNCLNADNVKMLTTVETADNVKLLTMLKLLQCEHVNNCLHM